MEPLDAELGRVAMPRLARDVTAEDARWSIWFYRPGRWRGRPVYFGRAEGCARTLLIGSRWTGCIVLGLWRARFDPECPDCRARRAA